MCSCRKPKKSFSPEAFKFRKLVKNIFVGAKKAFVPQLVPPSPPPEFFPLVYFSGYGLRWLLLVYLGCPMIFPHPS